MIFLVNKCFVKWVCQRRKYRSNDFKYQRGKYHPNAVDSSSFDLKNNRADDLYSAMGDTAFFNDSVQYPIGKIFGQDVFRNNDLNFFNRAFDAQAPENYLLGEGDELTISIWGMAEHSESVVVNEKRICFFLRQEEFILVVRTLKQRSHSSKIEWVITMI